MNPKTLTRLALCLCLTGITSEASAQYYVTLAGSSYPYSGFTFFRMGPRYLDLNLKQVISHRTSGGITSFRVKTTSNAIVTLEVSETPWPHFFLYPAGVWPDSPSTEFVSIANRLMQALQTGNDYDISLEDVWINSYYQPGVYKLTGYTKIRFTHRNIIQYPSVDTLVRGFFEDSSSAFYGNLVLRRYSSSGTQADITYPLARRNNPISACQVDALRLVDNFYNAGLLDLIDSAVEDGAVEINHYCGHNGQRIVHRGTDWLW